ncbi:hypothetical protein CYMTET_42892 [Cymbomonas tetramitiformis]|uniref:Uncharacterized protein n=1 Tax=Cymbomonas tetramitiformis TaxID=36881 RepID=A0AAE0C3A3_9CHLO|nr:hypothetical protein CYMTET_42892 [Cymbomonas tetramitiformis]
MGCGSSNASKSKYDPVDDVVSPTEVRDDTATTRRETAASTRQTTQEKRPVTEEIASAEAGAESHARQLNSLSLKLGENVSDSFANVDLPAVISKTNITPKWFFSFYAQLIDGALSGVDDDFTTGMLVEQFIKPRTLREKCRYTACAECAPEAAAQKVECFVAHAWSMPLSQLVGGLQAAVHDNDHPLTEDSPIWLDMLELNPHDSPQISQLMELRQVVSSCEYLLLSLDPSSTVLQRAWPRFAVYEAFSAEIPLYYLRSDVDWACFQEEIYQIDMLQPQAADDPFQSLVANQLVSEWGDSQEDLDSILTTFLLEAAYKHVRKVYEACALENDEKLVAARNCAALMQSVQLLTEAIELRQGALRLAEELYSDSSEKILPDLEGLAELYKCQKDFSEAEQLLLRCKVIKVSTVPACVQTVLNTYGAGGVLRRETL